ncbi:MAG: GspJ family T2SS minor pseudopilin variant LspJ [Legionellales bacterium]|nr:GspJ family T2SS minor pseudopilin variant LspJ [Legionellales bacterium]
MKSYLQGYTLIEIMIALAVFALISAITASAMFHAFDTRGRVNEQANQLNALQLGLSMLSHDIEQMIERPIHGDEMHVFPPFIGQSHYVEFSSGGSVNPNGILIKSTLKRVGYLCQNKQLIRRRWDTLDTPHRNLYHDKVLFDHLLVCQFSYLASNHQTLQEWHEYAVQQNQKKETLPQAVQISLTPTHWGNMNLLFAIPEALYAS